MPATECGKGLARGVGDDAECDRLARGEVGQQRLEILRRAPIADGHQLAYDPVGFAERPAKASGAADVGEGDQHFVPRPGARQRDFELDDDAIGAVGVDRLHDLFAAQLEARAAALPW